MTEPYSLPSQGLQGLGLRHPEKYKKIKYKNTKDESWWLSCDAIPAIKCCLSMVMLGDASIFHFGHVREGSQWPEFSKSKIRDERRRKQEQLSPQQLNMHRKHPGGRRKGAKHLFFSCLEMRSDDLLSPQLLTWISRNGKRDLFLTCRWQPWPGSTKISIFPTQATLGCFQG